jgi:hypothetical protein
VSCSGRLVLGLDLGTSCGWALGRRVGGGDGGAREIEVLASGVWKLKPSRWDGGGMRYLRLRNYLEAVTYAVADSNLGESDRPMTKTVNLSVPGRFGQRAGHAIEEGVEHDAQDAPIACDWWPTTGDRGARGSVSILSTRHGFRRRVGGQI